MAEHADDQLGSQPEIPRRPGLGVPEPLHDRLVRDAPRGVRLRVEEHFRVDDAVGVRAGEVGVREGLEVPRVQEHRHADEVVVQEVVEGREAAVAREERRDG